MTSSGVFSHNLPVSQPIKHSPEKLGLFSDERLMMHRVLQEKERDRERGYPNTLLPRKRLSSLPPPYFGGGFEFRERERVFAWGTHSPSIQKYQQSNAERNIEVIYFSVVRIFVPEAWKNRPHLWKMLQVTLSVFFILKQAFQ